MQHEVVLGGKRHARPPQFGGGVAGAPRGQGDAEATAAESLPPADEFGDRRDRIRRRPALHLRAGLEAVHQRRPDPGADAKLGGGLEGRFGVTRRLHAEHGRRPGAQELGDAQPSRRAHRRRVVGLLERPHPGPQPVDHVEVVGQPAEQRLAQVHMGLHQSGQHQSTGCVDDGGGRLTATRHLGDAAVLDIHRPLDGTTGGEDEPAAHEQVSHR